MAQKKRRRKPARQSELPAWIWMLFGLAIGLSVAFAIYINGRDAPRLAVKKERPESASMKAEAEAAVDNNGESQEADDKEPRFSFYDVLPNFEVIIPEEEPDVTVDHAPKSVDQPGQYVLQAGSFSSYADADRRRAELALQGIESRIQRVSIDDKTYHRVRIGPIRDLNELNLLRSRLRAAHIDVLRIRLGD